MSLASSQREPLRRCFVVQSMSGNPFANMYCNTHSLFPEIHRQLLEIQPRAYKVNQSQPELKLCERIRYRLNRIYPSESQVVVCKSQHIELPTHGRYRYLDHRLQYETRARTHAARLPPLPGNRCALAVSMHARSAALDLFLGIQFHSFRNTMTNQIMDIIKVYMGQNAGARVLVGNQCC